MLFTSISFLYYFLPIVLLGYFIVPNKIKNYWLLISSLIFYLYGDSKYLLLMISEIFICYIGGLVLEKHKNKYLLALFLIIHLGLLGYFKYIDFLIRSINNIFNSNLKLLNVLLPIGISFYTFQIISYLIDVYRGKIKAQDNFFNLATYVSLFPQLIAGPIVRYEDINDNLIKKDISIENVAVSIKRFTIGLGKKVLIANVLGSFCTSYLNSPDKSVVFSFFYMLCYTMQVFFDFAGYSDMAIGLGKILGFNFLENFNYPFISKSITEFWQRWHISLGSWFRDYVYIPLGGSRVNKYKLIRNILVVWTLTGLWHGAAWNFIIWGLYFGIILLIEKLVLKKYLDKMPNILKHLYVLLIVGLSFVIFGADNMTGAFDILKNIGGLNGLPFYNKITGYYLRNYIIIIILGILFSTPIIKNIIERLKKKDSIKKIINLGEIVLILIIFLLVTSSLIDNSYNPFLYFRF